MFNSKCLRNAASVVLLVLLVLATGLQAQSSATPAGDQLLKMIPAESLFCLRVNNFEYTVCQGKLFEFLGTERVPHRKGLSAM